MNLIHIASKRLLFIAILSILYFHMSVAAQCIDGGNCLVCANPTQCQTCMDGSFQNSNYQCQLCPKECQSCSSPTQCTQCTSYYTMQPDNTCKEICGDSYTQIYACDNALGVPYDGCDDNCYVMPDFQCTVTDHITLCSYVSTPSIFVDSLQVDETAQYFIVTLQAQNEMLYIFEQLTESQIKQFFRFGNLNISIVQVKFQINKIILNCSINSTQQIGWTVLLLETANTSYAKYYNNQYMDWALFINNIPSPTTQDQTQTCPKGCQICSSPTQCTQCAMNYTMQPDNICKEICGDSYTENYPCDNAIGVPFDGCDDNCNVMPGFSCSVTNHTTKCAYTSQINIWDLSIAKNYAGKQIYVSFSFTTPLNIFSEMTENQLRQLISLNNSNFQLGSANYAFEYGSLRFHLRLVITYTQSQVTLLSVCFNTSISSYADHFANQSFVFDIQVNDSTQAIQTCPKGCQSCSSQTQCNQCTSYYTMQPDNICKEICGDSYTQNYPCDNAIGVPYDGCDDDCYVMPDFQCTVTDHITLCSYIGSIDIFFGSFQLDKATQQFNVTLFFTGQMMHIFGRFTESQHKQFFSFSNPNISIVSAKFEFNQLILNCFINSNQYIGAEMLYFKTDDTTNSKYFNGQTSSGYLFIDYTPNTGSTNQGETQTCPKGCQTCSSPTQCTQCTSYYTLQPDNICKEICGDSYTENYACDNAIGVPYDGCDDNCNVMADFSCTVTDHITSCAYIGEFNLYIAQFSLDQVTQYFNITVQTPVFPYIFRQFKEWQLKQFFSFSNPNISLVSAKFEFNQLILNCFINSNQYIGGETLYFKTDDTSNAKYFNGQTSSWSLHINYTPQSSSTTQGQTQTCPKGCQTCSSQTQCNQCTSYYTMQSDNTCKEICGDSYTENYACDNALGVPYDGCDDNCYVMFGFSCTVTDHITSCVYIGSIEIYFGSLQLDQVTQHFNVSLVISGYMIHILGQFNESQHKQFFSFSNPNISLVYAKFELNTLILNCFINSNQYIGAETLYFKTANTSNAKYFDAQSKSWPLFIGYIPQNQSQTQTCPKGCQTCSSPTQCTQCTSYYTLQPDNICKEICGDSYTENYACDNAIGVPYDGCDDNCNVMFNFQCSITDHTTICAYTSTLTFGGFYVRIHYQTKNIQFDFQVQPRLHILTLLSDEDIGQIFSFQNPQISITNFYFDRYLWKFYFNCTINSTKSMYTAQISFNTQNTTYAQYFNNMNYIQSIIINYIAPSVQNTTQTQNNKPTCSQGCKICYVQDQCFQCHPNYYLNINHSCILITNQTQNQTTPICENGCKSCYSPTQCYQCYPGYTIQLNNTCTQTTKIQPLYTCSKGCQNCTSPTQCNLCKIGYEIQVDHSCKEICGDSYTENYACDNAIGVPYDGCDDNCQVMPGFSCDVTNGSSLCSFTGQLIIIRVDKQMNQKTQQLVLFIPIFPFLVIFKKLSQKQIKEFFTLQSSLSLSSARYNTNYQYFELSCIINSKQPIFMVMIYFNTSNTSNARFFNDQSSSINLFVNVSQLSSNKIQDQSENIKPNEQIPSSFEENITKQKSFSKFVEEAPKVLHGSSYAISTVSWTTVALGLVFKKLGGLEAIFVTQFSFVSVLSSSDLSAGPLNSLEPLKFATGFNFGKSNNNGGKSRLLQSSVEEGVNQFLSNNFNFSFIVLAIPLLIVLAIYVRLRIFIKMHPTIKLSNTCNKSEKNINDSNKINHKSEKQITIQQQSEYEYEEEKLLKITKYYSTACQLLMYCTLFNLTYFFACSGMFFISDGAKDTANIILLLLGTCFFLGVFLAFDRNPQLFGFFHSSFRPQTIATFHYFLYSLMLIVVILLLTLLPSLPYLGLIPCSAMLLYTLIYQPYIEKKQNFRSAFNLLVMCSFIVLKIYLFYCPTENINSATTFTLIILNVLVLLPIVIVVSLASTVYYWYNENYVKPAEDENYVKEQEQKERERLYKILTNMKLIQNQTMKSLAQIKNTQMNQPYVNNQIIEKINLQETYQADQETSQGFFRRQVTFITPQIIKIRSSLIQQNKQNCSQGFSKHQRNPSQYALNQNDQNIQKGEKQEIEQQIVSNNFSDIQEHYKVNNQNFRLQITNLVQQLQQIRKLPSEIQKQKITNLRV